MSPVSGEKAGRKFPFSGVWRIFSFTFRRGETRRGGYHFTEFLTVSSVRTSSGVELIESRVSSTGNETIYCSTATREGSTYLRKMMTERMEVELDFP